MSFAAGARWTKCRAAHLSWWSRRVNANMLLHSRGLAASSVLLRLAAEARPPEGFVEQRGRCAAVAGNCMEFAGASDSDDDALIESIADLIDSVMSVNGFNLECMSGDGRTVLAGSALFIEQISYVFETARAGTPSVCP
eukprot:TRINITY_DN52991_c0_g1_i1.p1 TRINITY_DN52991_c0_g1~~TRINITY_DN52991_c0_g1_i1.p1  ORF type:complete len:150 (+),score=17.77 TRINITY_DN52991_c0_g1_i1:35-451(+)